MNFLSFVSNIFEPAVKLVDSLHTSDEEKLELRREIQQIENAFLSKLLEYETKIMENRSAVIQAEASGHSWLQRNWRPITMLTFLALVVLDSFGLLAFPLKDDAWTLLQIGLGGYVAGRSAEKITHQVISGRNQRAREAEAKG